MLLFAHVTLFNCFCVRVDQQFYFFCHNNRYSRYSKSLKKKRKTMLTNGKWCYVNVIKWSIRLWLCATRWWNEREAERGEIKREREGRQSLRDKKKRRNNNKSSIYEFFVFSFSISREVTFICVVVAVIVISMAIIIMLSTYGMKSIRFLSQSFRSARDLQQNRFLEIILICLVANRRTEEWETPAPAAHRCDKLLQDIFVLRMPWEWGRDGGGGGVYEEAINFSSDTSVRSRLLSFSRHEHDEEWEQKLPKNKFTRSMHEIRSRKTEFDEESKH